MNVYITFSGTRYDATTKLTVADAPRFGADRVLVYDDVWLLKTRYAREAKWLLDHPRTRGVGWFCWKPFILLDALSRCEPGDVVLFTDGDTYPIHDLRVLFEIGRRDGIMLFRANGWPHQRVWCKRACFRMMDQDEPRYHEAPCGVARFMVFTHRHIPFLEEWYRYCLQPRGQTFDLDPNDGPELPGFKEHRAEQAIMTNLAHKYGHKLYREADEWGDTTDPQGLPDSLLDRDLYPRLFTQIYGQSPGDITQGSAYRNV